MVEVINEEVKVLPDVVTELLARIGEAGALHTLMTNTDMLTSDMDVPKVAWKWAAESGDDEAVFCVDNEPRRLVYIPGFDWLWYNAEGPEE